MRDTAAPVPDLLENLRLELRRGCLVLAALAALRTEQYGYTLRKLLADRGLDIDEGTLYPLLRRLEAEAFDRVDAVDRLDQQRLALALGAVELGQAPAEGAGQDADDDGDQRGAEQHHQGELEVERAFQAYAAKNVSPASAPFFIGAGAYRHHVPATVDYMIQRGEFLTSYTPYQPEVAQGTLQMLFEFQTQVALITGMEVANASLYDGATAAAEAVMMANRLTRRKRAVLLAEGTNGSEPVIEQPSLVRF